MLSKATCRRTLEHLLTTLVCLLTVQIIIDKIMITIIIQGQIPSSDENFLLDSEDDHRSGPSLR